MNSDDTIRVMRAPDLPRLRARRVEFNLKSFSINTARSGAWDYCARDGGTVANSYGYRAQTEVILAIADPLGRVAAWYGRVPANKTTRCGAARGALGTLSTIKSHPCGTPWEWWDERCGEARRAGAEHALRTLWRLAYPEDETPASDAWYD